MKKNLSDFVILNKSAISNELCDLTVHELEASSDWKRHVFKNYVDSQLFEIISDHDPIQHTGNLTTSVISPLMDIYWKTIYKYIVEDIKYDWFTSWQGFDPLKFLQYTPNTEMRNHCDHIHSMFDGQKKGVPILTVIAQLNNDFTGGEFTMFDNEHIGLEKGDILIFPSSFMFPHTVQKITEGVRYSATSWVF